VVQYYQHPFDTTLTRMEFFRQLPQYTLAGERFVVGDGLNDVAIDVLVIALIAWGVRTGWREPVLRPMLITFIAARVIGSMLPLISPAAAEVRFVPWAGLLVCVALSAVVLRFRKPVVVVIAMVVVVSWFVV